MAEEVTLKRSEIDARIGELRQQLGVAYDNWQCIQGALLELEFVKRRFTEAVEASQQAGETEPCQPSSVSPQGSST